MHLEKKHFDPGEPSLELISGTVSNLTRPEFQTNIVWMRYQIAYRYTNHLHTMYVELLHLNS